MINNTFVSEMQIMRHYDSMIMEHWNGYSILLANELFYYFSRNDKHDFVLILTYSKDLSDEEM